ncbi:hypothetical protein SKAU_G00382670, partial [Synaphobranchus kaupii]
SRPLPPAAAAPVAGEHGGNVPSTTFIPVTPKIGMGKPAISKRKFSPGRPRAKQGARIAHGNARSPSWSPDQSEGWDSPKTRQSPTAPTWSIKVGRGSGFPGRRRPRGAGLSGRGGRGRSKPKNGINPIAAPGVPLGVMETAFPGKEEEENAMHNTVVMFSSSDTFTLKQDMCVVCGSFGQGTEGRLLACAQCGQCYHPFCVSIKITRVVLSKGWRCLECTVCEECGKATDPGRLLLCDDCDISYHTYCLDPPLQTVPTDSWKCKWCVSCTQCGATSPGPRCEWQNNYTQCAPCASLAACPVCLRDYCEEEIIVQCRQCDRWIHASCQNLNTEEEVENAADDSFDCTMCRAHMLPSQVTTVAAFTESAEQPIAAQIVAKAKELDPGKTYTQDGVCLTESGLSQLQSLAAAASRRKRPKPKLKLKIINQNSVAVLQTPPDPQSEHSRDGDLDDSREGDHLDCEGKSDSSPEREAVDEDTKGAEGPDGAKKRKRKPYRPGIGGFMVRQRSRPGQGKAKRSLSRKDSSGSVSENPLGKDEGWSEALPDTPLEESVPGSECLEKAKKRYRKKKTKLEEAFPSYLQEAFFGKELLDKSRQSKQALETGTSDDDRGHAHADSKPPSASFLDPSSDPLLSAAAAPIAAKPGAPTNPEDPLEDLSEVLNTDADILGMLSGDLGKPANDSGLGLCPFQVENPPSPFAGLDIGPIADDSAATPQALPARGPRALPEEPLDHILSPELDKMVTDGAILSKLYKIPELEGKDVEELFTAVLSPNPSQPPQLVQPPPSATVPPPPGPAMPLSNPGNGMFPRMPMMNGMMGRGPHFVATPLSPGAGPCVSTSFSPLHRLPFPDSARDKTFSPMGRDGAGPWGTPGPAPPPEGEADTMSNAQRSTLKWEKEETLGEMATVAPVLYTNVNFPNLRDEFPDWSTRVKQIAKLWRKASSQERAPYVQKARDNRAALRINKVQLSNESIKRQQQQQQHPQQPPDTFDPIVPMDTDSLFKDPLKHKESEHEQEWKFRQPGNSSDTPEKAQEKQMRQKSKQQAKIEATQKLEQVKSEQQQLQQQQQLGSQTDGETPDSDDQSPTSPQTSNGNVSPMQQAASKDGFARPPLPGPSTPGPTDDVFLRPPPPPPAGSRTPAQDTCLQGQSSQPQSPQVFSPGSSGSRPSSPWDPYAKMVGTPRPPPLGSSTPRRNSESGKSPRSLVEQQERGRPSPAHESFGSPTSMSSDPYAKPPDTPRPVAAADPFLKPMGPPRPSPGSEHHGRLAMSSMAGDTFVRPALRNEVYQRMSQNKMILSDPYSRPLLTPIPGSNESGSVPVFKMPMPPPQSQDPYGSMISAPRRGSVDVYERPMLTPRLLDGFSQNQLGDPYAHPPLTPRPSMNDCFPNPPRMVRHPQGNPFTQPGACEPQRDPYAHAPSTPRPNYSQSMPDPYAQPPGTPRPSSDPYAQPPGTPRPSSDPYAQPPGTPRPSSDPYAQPPGTPRPSSDPYAQPPGTPRPSADPYAQPPGTPRPQTDPYAQPPGTPRPSSSPYPQPPSANIRPVAVEQYLQQPQQSPNQKPSPSHSADPYAQPPGTPRPMTGDRFSKSPGSQRNSDPYAHPPGTPRPLSNDPYGQPPGTPRPVLSDPYAQPPGTPRPGAGPDGFNRPISRSGPTSSQDPFSPPQARMQETFVRPAAPGSQTPKHSGMSDNGFSPSHLSNQTPVHDPYEQSPMTPRPPSGERLSHDMNNQVTSQEGGSQDLGQFSTLPQSAGTPSEAHNAGPADTEEKFRQVQRQRIRELILKQQQQKQNAVRQEKGLQELGVAAGPGTPPPLVAGKPQPAQRSVQQAATASLPRDHEGSPEVPWALPWGPTGIFS